MRFGPDDSRWVRYDDDTETSEGTPFRKVRTR
jgi:hypothetical protein